VATAQLGVGLDVSITIQFSLFHFNLCLLTCESTAC